jgi:hypothetical protein
MQLGSVRGSRLHHEALPHPSRHLGKKGFGPVHRGMSEEAITALGHLRPQLIQAGEHHRRIDAACDPRGRQGVVPCQKPSTMQTPTLPGGGPRHRGAEGLPRVWERGRSAEARPITIPQGTLPAVCTGVPAGDPLLPPGGAVRVWRVGRRLLDPVPARAFFAEPFAGFGPDALARLLCHRRHNGLDLFGGGGKGGIHLWRLVHSEDRRPSAPGPLIETDEPPSLPALSPGGHAPWVDRLEAGHLWERRALRAQQEALGAHTGAS